LLSLRATIRRYLFREGLAGEHGLTAAHTEPRLIAAWDGVDGLEPPRTAGGGRDLRLLAAALNAPLLAAGLPREDWQDARPIYAVNVNQAVVLMHSSGDTPLWLSRAVAGAHRAVVSADAATQRVARRLG